MDFSEKLLNGILHIIATVQGMGKPKEYIYQVGKLKFYVRKGTTDRFTVNYTCKRQAYTIPPEGTVVDIGASIGDFAICTAYDNPFVKVYAFEPENSNYKQLLKNIALNKVKNVHPAKLAVGSSKKKVSLNVSGMNKGATSFYDSFTTSTQKVRCIGLKDAFALIKSKRIDFLKIDAEGAEYEILLDAGKKVLQRIGMIELEFHDYLGLKHNHEELIDYLVSSGFHVESKTGRILRYFFKQGLISATNKNFH